MSQSALPTLERLPHPSPVADDARAGLIADPGFGKVFTDYMVTIRYTEGGAGTARHSARAAR